ncbi:dTDP-glucose 4,6-dehydratase [Caldinitratiruptor microaerophilus]|uniref:dTDP-glucose 4,6-dehydratase n=1 Tax=Caldinitratiruptor microaerophilus TaxID=671077 RepID=A0AA35G7S0_9FIRM|nr:dTDP-glucose 4,6-dehydratase [Caldinitratiruptor microaerophilus]BDG60366.1 dTDP-glucose 4,6-dehydratase [Caldinitratiruptor microaerophilus]
MARRILVTGGAGFIGSNFIRYVLDRHPDWRVVNLDLLTYAGNPANLRDVEGHPGYRFVHGDIGDMGLVRALLAEEAPDAVVHFAAESHVDRSIAGPEVFVRTNVLGTQVLLEAVRQEIARREAVGPAVGPAGSAAARGAGPEGGRPGLLFVQVSTDEVYGSLGPTGLFTEETPLAPNSPYSASKAGADLLVRAYHHTYGLPAIITRCSNNYGPYQYPEKLIPFFITRALADEYLPVYGDGLNVRDWLYVEDHCAALELVLLHGRPGAVYNIGGGNERTNLEITRRILAELGKPESLIRFVPDRPGHDRRYAMDATKIRRELGWEPRHSFEEGLRRTIDWYLTHRDWWEPLLASSPA